MSIYLEAKIKKNELYSGLSNRQTDASGWLCSFYV